MFDFSMLLTAYYTTNFFEYFYYGLSCVLSILRSLTQKTFLRLYSLKARDVAIKRCSHGPYIR